MRAEELQRALNRMGDFHMKQWESFPAWCDMTEEQRLAAIALAEQQGEQSAKLRKKYGTQ